MGIPVWWRRDGMASSSRSRTSPRTDGTGPHSRPGLLGPLPAEPGRTLLDPPAAGRGGPPLVNPVRAPPTVPTLQQHPDPRIRTTSTVRPATARTRPAPPRRRDRIVSGFRTPEGWIRGDDGRWHPPPDRGCSLPNLEYRRGLVHHPGRALLARGRTRAGPRCPARVPGVEPPEAGGG